MYKRATENTFEDQSTGLIILEIKVSKMLFTLFCVIKMIRISDNTRSVEF